MKIQTTNLNGYNHVLSSRCFNERALLTFVNYGQKLPIIWGFQEVPTGGKGHGCLNYFKSLANQRGYITILPANWEITDHPKSIQNVLLLKKQEVKTLEVLKMEEELELLNRCNYVKVVFHSNPEQSFYIINIHAPQTKHFPGHATNDGYVKLRKHLSYQFFDVLEKEVGKLISSGKNIILMGDFNESLQEASVQKLLDIGLMAASEMEDNSYLCTNDTESPIDHILVSKNIIEEKMLTNYRVDADFVKKQKLSDHPTISLDIAV